MMTKKVFLILIIPFLMEMIFACCDCGESEIFYFSHSNLKLQILDNSGSKIVTSDSDSILKHAFGIRVQLSRNKSLAFNQFYNLNLFPSCYASKCNCPPETLHLASDTISSIKLENLTYFNSQHPANSDITEYFVKYDNLEFETIYNFLNNQETKFEVFENMKLTFDLLLMTAPETAANQKFKLTIKLSDDRILIAETKLIKLF